MEEYLKQVHKKLDPYFLILPMTPQEAQKHNYRVDPDIHYIKAITVNWDQETWEKGYDLVGEVQKTLPVQIHLFFGNKEALQGYNKYIEQVGVTWGTTYQ